MILLSFSGEDNMEFDIGFISAETHTPEYLMHKYWARKPHNVINECILQLTPANGVVLDPFCGSGVTLRESSVIGRKCYGFDINPSAYQITKVLINPPSASEFEKIINPILDSLNRKYGHLYTTKDGKRIKYLSHRISIRCSCGKTITQKDCGDNKSVCPYCGKRVHFNLESMVFTKVFSIVVEGEKNYEPSLDEINIQEKKSNYFDNNVNTSKYDFSFPCNRRILAFDGIKTSSFFTNRNFTILCALADSFNRIESETIRDAALLLLTGSVAQCSRLIAHRNNLSTGGPAWSVPGFWIPQEHLETNPFIHLSARKNKFIKALKCLNANPAKVKPEVFLGNSLKLLRNNFKDLKVDLIFLDPPYGDSIPYTEFSNVWNSFLGVIPNSNDDISVSDRIDKNDSWKNYELQLNLFMEQFSKHLKENGKMLITFNNNDLKAWSSLISSLQNNDFVCKKVFYQIPAVISSKAQMSPNSSYISDIYSVFIHDDEAKPSKDLSPLINHLRKVASARKGKLSRTVLDREFIVAWLKNNIDCKLLGNKSQLISSLFNALSNTTYELKSELLIDCLDLHSFVNSEVRKECKKGPIGLFKCYAKIANSYPDAGTIDYSEFKEMLDNCVVDNGLILGCLSE